MTERTEVVVTDVQIPFGSMVVLIIKWTIASIPAMLIVVILGVITSVVLGGMFAGLVGLGG